MPLPFRPVVSTTLRQPTLSALAPISICLIVRQYARSANLSGKGRPRVAGYRPGGRCLQGGAATGFVGVRTPTGCPGLEVTEMTRKVTANIMLSLDGRVNGAGGDYDMSWIVQPATTAVLGLKNYEGFGGFWPAVADDQNASPQDRAFSRWLNTVEKVVFSSTLTEAPWQNSRVVDADP